MADTTNWTIISPVFEFDDLEIGSSSVFSKTENLLRIVSDGKGNVWKYTVFRPNLIQFHSRMSVLFVPSYEGCVLQISYFQTN